MILGILALARVAYTSPVMGLSAAVTILIVGRAVSVGRFPVEQLDSNGPSTQT